MGNPKKDDPKSNEKTNKTGGKVCELAKELEKKLHPGKILNIKYAVQNFHMQKEMKIYENKIRKEEDEKNDEL